MRAALALAAALFLISCNGVKPAVQDARQALGAAAYYAAIAVDVTQAVCQIDPKGRPCAALVAALDAFFSKAVPAEEALNRGEEVDVEALEAEIKAIVKQAQDIYRSMV